MSSTDSAASDPLTEEEKRGIDLLGHSGERNDAIAGVSDDPDATSESGGEREG